jgi:hypothetical protein
MTSAAVAAAAAAAARSGFLRSVGREQIMETAKERMWNYHYFSPSIVWY